MKKFIVTLCVSTSMCYAVAQTSEYSEPSNAGNTGSYSTSLGHLAGSAGTYNTVVGYKAGDVISGSYNSFYGAEAGKLAAGSSNNAFFGYNSGSAVTSGNYNSLFGVGSGMSLSTTASNTFFGYYSGAANTGSNNVYLGASAGRSSGSGSYNVFIGNSAGYNESGSNKLYIENSSTSIPLIYGDFSANQVGINSLPSGTHALTVGGSIAATSIYVNGSQAGAWYMNGSNMFYQTGNVSIGTNNAMGYKLAVAGKIISEEVVIKLLSNWPDYVFAPSYSLRTLSEVETFVRTNRHLPGVPTADDITANGIAVGEMNKILLEKVEELTLYIIELEKRIRALEK